MTAPIPVTFQKHLHIGFVVGDHAFDTDPFFRGDFTPTTAVSQTSTGPSFWRTTTTVLTGPAAVSRLNTGVVRTGTVTLTEVDRPLSAPEVTFTAFGGWLQGSSRAGGTTGFTGIFTDGDGDSGPLAALDDSRYAEPAGSLAAEYPFLAAAQTGPDEGRTYLGDFHVNQIGTLVGGNFITGSGTDTVIGDSDGHLPLLRVEGYGAVVAVPDMVEGISTLGGTFTGPAPGDTGVWGSFRTVDLF